MSSRRLSGVVAACVVAVCAVLISYPQSVRAGWVFQGLGDLPGGPSETRTADYNAVSADGSTVVGFEGTSGAAQAFYWTRQSGIVPLGFLPDGTTSEATGVSADGSVVVGRGNTASGYRGFRWTAGQGMVALDLLPGRTSGSAQDVSADGSLVVGWNFTSSDYTREAFRWTASGGTQGLGHLPGGDLYSDAYAVSEDGATIVGYADPAPLNPGQVKFQAVRWTESGGIAGIGPTHSSAHAVSADGSVVVGQTWGVGSVREAFRWTAAGGVVSLGHLDGTVAWACAVSADGSVVVGCDSPSVTAPTAQAFVWDSAGGMCDIQQVLGQGGVPMGGWTLTSARGISGDARTIAGRAVNPFGVVEAWIARYINPGTTGSSPSEPLAPTVSAGRLSFSFELSASGLGHDEPLYIDPLAAAGYDCEIGGDVKFASLVLPGVGDGLFELHLWDGANWVFSQELSAWEPFVFPSGGIDRFRIMGIETAAGLDPSDPTAFPTGLTFVGSGPVNMTMTPVPVPEPPSLVLWLSAVGAAIGFLHVSHTKRRRLLVARLGKRRQSLCRMAGVGLSLLITFGLKLSLS